MESKAQQPPRKVTGEFRRDIRIFPADPDGFGNCNWTLFDPVSDRYFKISDYNYRIIGLLDRSYPIDEFLDKLKRNGIRCGEEELHKVIGFLRNNGLLAAEYGETEILLNHNRAMKKAMFWHVIMSSYLFFRIPLFKPDRFLERTREIVAILINPWVIMLLSMIALGGYISLVPAWNQLAGELLKSISIEGLLRYSLAIVAIKIIHEFAHAYTAKAFGVRVRRMGIAMIIFFPRLYTDLTDAWQIRDRRKRLLIDAAGIIAEIIIGGIAALVWANTGPGSVHTIAYYVFAVSVINTLLVNGNPFIRYDGYYILMDLLNIDNLQKRGAEKVKSLFRGYFFGLDYPADNFARPWKNIFLACFGICGFFYRIFLYTSIILVVYFQFTKAVGIILLCLEVHVLIIKPLITEGKSIMSQRKKFKRKHLFFAYSLLGVVLLPLIAPLPWVISSPCEVKSAAGAVIYNQNDGYIEAITVANGATVHRGEHLLRLQSPALEWQLRNAELSSDQLREEIDQMRSSGETLAAANVKLQQLKASVNLIAELRRRRNLLEIKSPQQGTVVFFNENLQPGKFIPRGIPIAEVFNPESLRVLALVREEDIEHIRVGGSVTITMSGELKKQQGTIVAINPVPIRFMPPGPMLDVFGGPVLSRRDTGYAFELITPYYQVIVKPDANTALRVGRVGSVWFRKYTSIGWTLFSKALTILRRELTF